MHPTPPDLVYNIVEQTLQGRIDGVAITAQAVSGGRAGSKTPGVVNFFLANNPYMTRVKEHGAQAGGPIAIARYAIHTHKTTPNWLRLIPVAGYGERLHGRDGFAIHGRGPIGSQGCIVPTDFNVVEQLYALVKAREAADGPAPTLEVVAIGDFERFDRLQTTA